jgi:hypothetical protein
MLALAYARSFLRQSFRHQRLHYLHADGMTFPQVMDPGNSLPNSSRIIGRGFSGMCTAVCTLLVRATLAGAPSNQSMLAKPLSATNVQLRQPDKTVKRPWLQQFVRDSTSGLPIRNQSPLEVGRWAGKTDDDRVVTGWA